MNWLTIAAAVLCICMVLFGAMRGFTKMILSLAAFTLTFFIASAVYRPIADLVRDHTGVYNQIEAGIGEYVDKGLEKTVSGAVKGAEEMIDSLPLPAVLRNTMKKENKTADYKEMGVHTTAEYITVWLSEVVFSALIYAIAFAAVRIGFFVLTILLGLLVELPGIREIDRLAGGLCGFALSILILWIGGVIITAGAGSGWGQDAIRMIEESPLLSLVYNYNILLNGLL